MGDCLSPGPSPGPSPWPSLADHWRARFGERVQRVALDAGFSCPNRDGTRGTGGCAFCDPRSFSPAVGDPRPVAAQLAAGIARLEKRGIRRAAAYFQPHTNTYAPLPSLVAAWDAAAAFPAVVAVCVGTRPDCVPDPVLDLLARYRERFEVWLELGLPSAREATLARLSRGHGAGAFAAAAARARARGLRVCAHVILGLPGEGPGDEAHTAEVLVDAEVDGVKLHHLAVVRETALEAPWRAGDLALLTEEEYVARAAAFLARLPQTTVLHRLVGDTAGDRLLAPRYDKARAVAAIRARLAAR